VRVPATPSFAHPLHAPRRPPHLQEQSKQPDAESREEVERAVKKRVMGNMRLISELYKLDMVKDWIMTYCIEELLSAPKGKLPPEDNIEVGETVMAHRFARINKRSACVGPACLLLCTCLWLPPSAPYLVYLETSGMAWLLEKKGERSPWHVILLQGLQAQLSLGVLLVDHGTSATLGHSHVV